MVTRRTAELLAEEKAFRPHIVAALGVQARITTDGEGWPMVPGRYGRLEWRGAEADTGEHRIYAFTDHAKMIAKLRRIPGCHPKQIGDQEAAFWIKADDLATVRAVSARLGLRRRRVLTSDAAKRMSAKAASGARIRAAVQAGGAEEAISHA